MRPPLGLIAGEGVFPLLVARGARAAGRGVVCVGLSGSVWPELREEVDRFDLAGVAKLGRWVRLLRAGGCAEAIMVGRVRKEKMYQRFTVLRNLPDWEGLKFWLRLKKDKRSQSLFDSLTALLASKGITLVDSTQYCREHLAGTGVMTRCQPTPEQWADVRFGWDRCSTISRLDIGQALAVQAKDVIAVEALEGTNAMIERAGLLCRHGGWTLIKVSNKTRDMRLDVPTVGTTTIEKLHAARAACLVLEAGTTIMLEKPKVLELAERYKIAVIGYDPATAAAGAAVSS